MIRRVQRNSSDRGAKLVSCLYLFCIIYYALSIHSIHQQDAIITKLGDIWLHVSAVTGHLQAN